MLNRKQAHNRGGTIPNRNISGAGLSFALDKILTALSASHADEARTTDVVVCVSGIRPSLRDVTQILRALWSCGIQCAVVQANNAEDSQEMAKDLGAIYYIVCTEDGILRVRSWINDRFEERLLNRDEIIAYIKKALSPEPEIPALQALNLNDMNKYNRSNVSLSEPTLPSVYVIFNTVEKMTASARKRQESVVTKNMTESLLLFNKREEITVVAVDLQSNIIRAIASAIDPRANTNFRTKEIDAEVALVIDRFPNNKRYIRDVMEEIGDIYSEKKRPPVVCLYSLKDSYYRFIL